jgi:hypothetical protein
MEQHKSCAAEQFEIGFDHENNRKYVQYTPRVTQIVQGGLKHRRVEINPIIQYEDRSNPRWNPNVLPLSKTMLLLSPDAVSKENTSVSHILTLFSKVTGSQSFS